MTGEPLDELYFKWLYGQVGSIKLKNPSRTYWALLRQLFTKEFVWIIPNDDNRLEDGRDLRQEFMQEQKVDVDPQWLDLGCSMLEMLIALSRRLSFEDDTPADEWFWTLIENLGLRSFSDKNLVAADFVDEVLDDVIWRTYDSDGKGGLFPLKNPGGDQRDIEIWYQLSAYLIENN
jgi:hypothetical protein